MARPRQYNRDAVLDAAVRSFWKRGYEGTSVRDLVETCGVTTRTMYDAFRNKDRFFEAALDRYRKTVLEPMIDLLQKDQGFAALRRFADVFAASATADGCLFVNTAAERNLVRRSALNRVEKYFERLRRTFQRKLEEARAGGLFDGDSDIRSAQLVATVTGLILTGKVGTSGAVMRAVLAQLLADLHAHSA